MPDSRLALVAALLVLAACSREPAPATEPVVLEAPAAPVDACAPPAAAGPVDPEAPKPEVPTLIVETFDDGCFDLAKQRGQWVVVNFWATWCTPCLKEIPDLAEFDARRDDVQVVGLAYEDITREDMAAFLQEHPIAYPFAILDTTAPPPDFEIPKALPMTVLITPEGRVAKAIYAPVTGAELDKLIADAGKAPEETAVP